jgi:hypothetical protein
VQGRSITKMKFQKGHKLNVGDKNPMYGTHCNSNETNGMWKDDVGYSGLHKWIRRNLPKPIGYKCEICDEELAYDVACITGIYNRVFNNWQWLCRKCHVEFDPIRLRNTKTGRFV